MGVWQAPEEWITDWTQALQRLIDRTGHASTGPTGPPSMSCTHHRAARRPHRPPRSGAARPARCRPRLRRRAADRRRRQPPAAALRGRVRRAVRHLAGGGLLRQDPPAPAQPRRGPPSQRRVAPHRGRAAPLAPAHPRRRRQAHDRRQDQQRDPSLPQALRRPRSLHRAPPDRPSQPGRHRLTCIGASGISWQTSSDIGGQGLLPRLILVGRGAAGGQLSETRPSSVIRDKAGGGWMCRASGRCQWSRKQNVSRALCGQSTTRATLVMVAGGLGPDPGGGLWRLLVVEREQRVSPTSPDELRAVGGAWRPLLGAGLVVDGGTVDD
jgi:hypothetical protein